MPLIRLVTEIEAPPERCFDLSRSLDLHVESMAGRGEHVVAGRASGLIEMGEEVTWRARHFGAWHEHASRITAFERPWHFRDEMIRGRFASFRHDHRFEATPRGTRMIDELDFESPWGVLGRVANRLVLTRHLERLLVERNEVIRRAAESGRT